MTSYDIKLRRYVQISKNNWVNIRIQILPIIIQYDPFITYIHHFMKKIYGLVYGENMQNYAKQIRQLSTNKWVPLKNHKAFMIQL